MNNLREKIETTKKHPHCQNCGKVDPPLHEDGDLANAYTQCCDEAVCRSKAEFEFGNETIKVRACCWAVAEMEFLAKGIDIESQKGMYRFRNESIE